jgi:two-component system, cell cycle response regulator
MPRQRPRVLLADASEQDSLDFTELLQLYNYEVLHAHTATAALELAQQDDFDAAVISLDLPDGGFTLSQQVQAIEGNSDLPIAFVTTSDVDEALLMEVQFYRGMFLHHKPYNNCALLAQISSLVRIKMLQDELKARMAELDRLASFDTLTGLYNRRLFLLRLEEELSRASRRILPLCLLYIDIDHFKEVNDRYGHAAGDAVLQQLTEVMSRGLRKSDVLGRIGGEEFSILLPETTGQGGHLISERLRQRVAETVCHYEELQLNVTISIGTLWVPNAAAYDVDLLMRLADDALYTAKTAGRNRVEYATTEGLQAPAPEAQQVTGKSS